MKKKDRFNTAYVNSKTTTLPPIYKNNMKSNSVHTPSVKATGRHSEQSKGAEMSGNEQTAGRSRS